MLSEKEYYALTEEMRKSRGKLPDEVKAEMVNIMKEYPNLIIYPATDNEIGAVLNYLNHKKDNSDIWLFDTFRYKDCLICRKFESDEWIVYKKDPDEQLWDLYDLIHSVSEAEEINADFADLKIIQKIV